MNASTSLYLIIIYPLYQIIEFIYRIFFELCGNEGISIIGVSIGVTILCLPLYAVAENWQQTERNLQKKMKPSVDRIKKTFKGDEQYMILSAFYKENHYHPMMALRSSFGLLIQIPFFLAAYSYLSNSTEIAGKSFLFIRNLSLPDNLFSIHGFGINILPIAMTLINILAGAVYTKGFGIREKGQIYGMALIFLVILYNSPSGLVLYWTMNNVFSLIKNVFYKLKNPLKAFYVMTILVLLGVDVYLAKHHVSHRIPVIVCSIAIALLPIAKTALSRMLKVPASFLMENKNIRTITFITLSACLFLFIGLVIPSQVVSSSPSEYSYIDGYGSPFYFLHYTALQVFGIFVFWSLCIYFLFNEKVQSYMTLLFMAVLFTGITDAFVFQGNYGIISPEFVFSEHRSFFPSVQEFMLNIIAIVAITTILMLLLRKKFFSTVKAILTITFMVLVLAVTVNYVTIYKGFKNTQKKTVQLSNIDPIIHLSKTGKNVIVFMLDRAAGYLMPDLLNELPDLKNHFTGFTFYPNTVSFASWTIQGAPCLYGGYEYTPWAMNHRRDLPMVEKHNQSLSLMPFIFESHGYTCDVIDPPYPNYDTPPIYGMFENHENITATSAQGKYDDIWYAENDYPLLPIKSTLIKRNMLWFCMFKISPLIIRPAIHYKDWWQEDDATSTLIGNTDFLKCYSVLDFLPELTDPSNTGNRFILIDNEATHDTGFCQAPEYKPQEVITNFGTSPWSDDRGYHGLAASLSRIAEWLDYLKENNVYDNTRIIFVADHGSGENSPLFESSNMPKSYEWFNPLLMVKDFNETQEFHSDSSFMTHSDTPALAMKDLIENPINPFTGNAIKELSTEEKNKECIISLSKANAVRTSVNNGFRISDDEWYTVHDDVFIKENWAKLHVVNGEKK
ncbi:MAG: membrane protein insertase YidC [Treponema sp.]|nr:membrane protein insertase YidC [Treponema sp.]